MDFDSIDAATLALPPHLHPNLTRRLALAGKHVMCEKPMAPDTTEALALVEFARTVPVTIMPGYLLRTNPHIRGFLDALRGMGNLRPGAFVDQRSQAFNGGLAQRASHWRRASR